jgi:hypothetical protein
MKDSSPADDRYYETESLTDGEGSLPEEEEYYEDEESYEEEFVEDEIVEDDDEGDLVDEFHSEENETNEDNIKALQNEPRKPGRRIKL